MSPPLLATKLYIPPPRPNVVSRARLLDQLNAGLHRKLTLVSAPAGFGKTTLISSWLNQINQLPVTNHQSPKAAWLSLDERDNEPHRFLRYVIAALQTVEPQLGAEITPLLQSPQPPPMEALLTTLLNEVAALSAHVILVLDDYHVLTDKAIAKALAFLLEQLPPQLHLVITTREDPPLPLARLRARDQLTELRAADLRFTPAEAADFLNTVMGLQLADAEIGALESRTEGWIAGLQMAALSMQGRADHTGFIEAFTGSHRFVLDYLAEEVLQRQPVEVRRFLLHTSLLEQLSGPLCNAVTERTDSQAMLEALERGNLFVIPLDDRREWFRYHHLFADVLLARLRDEQPTVVATLHQRAGIWCEQHGFAADAIRHALAANDFAHAANLVELAWPVFPQGHDPATWLGWVQALPDEVIRRRPVLSTGYAWTLLDHGELEAAAQRLDDAERWLAVAAETGPADSHRDEMVVVNHTEYRSLPATIASARAYMSQGHGDLPATIHHAQHALHLLAEEEHYWRGSTAMFLGLAQWAAGELAAAHRTMLTSTAQLHKAANNHLQIVATVMLADIAAAQGRLHDALATYEQALQLAMRETKRSDSPVATAHATAQAEPLLHGTVNLYVGLGELYREWGNLATAMDYLRRGQALGEQPVSPGSGARLSVALARVKAAQGDEGSALDLLDAAERRDKRDAIPRLRPAAALKAQIWLQQGRLVAAQEWVQRRGLAVDDEPSYLCEFELLTLARVRIAEYQQDKAADVIQDALDLLNRLLQLAEAQARTPSLIDILIVQALAHQAQDALPAALTSLQRALTLAEPAGYIQRFVDEGAPMQTLLAESLAQGASAAYVTQLLTALQQRTGAAPVAPDPNQLLIEPLSDRELEVLYLLARGHTNQAVADELVIAVSTVKKHVNNIFGKLGVSSRTQAVNRARELDLL